MYILKLHPWVPKTALLLLLGLMKILELFKTGAFLLFNMAIITVACSLRESEPHLCHNLAHMEISMCQNCHIFNRPMTTFLIGMKIYQSGILTWP